MQLQAQAQAHAHAQQLQQQAVAAAAAAMPVAPGGAPDASQQAVRLPALLCTGFLGLYLICNVHEHHML